MTCKCGKRFEEPKDGRNFENRYCSRKCFKKYSTYARMGWLFNSIDLTDKL